MAARMAHLADFFDGEDIKEIRDIFSSLMINDPLGHFTIEEQIVFPTIVKVLVSMKYGMLVKELITEHASILRLISELGNFLDAPLPEGPMRMVTVARMRMNMKHLTRMVIEHTAKERAEILPVLKGNASIRFLVGRAHLAHTVIAGKR